MWRNYNIWAADFLLFASCREVRVRVNRKGQKRQVTGGWVPSGSGVHTAPPQTSFFLNFQVKKLYVWPETGPAGWTCELAIRPRRPRKNIGLAANDCALFFRRSHKRTSLTFLLSRKLNPTRPIWKSWRLIARPIRATPSSSLLGGVGKIGVLENKSDNISQTRKQREKSYYGGPIETHLRSFERYHPNPPTASYFLRLGVRNLHPKLRSLLSQERVKLRTSNWSGTFIGSMWTKVH